MNTRIGVLGGIGPEATAEFYRKLIKKLQESGRIRSNTDFPQIIINSIPAPELIHEKISRKDLEPYLAGLRELDSLDVDFIVMMCNTIHIYRDTLQKEIRTPILDLRKEVENALKTRRVKSVLILGTTATINKRLYAFQDLACFEPDEEELERLSGSIFRFNKGVEKEKQAEIVKSVSEKYIQLGAEVVLLGCTELALMLADENIPNINTIDVLVEATIEKIKDFNPRK